jgi:hypothetical protein
MPTFTFHDQNIAANATTRPLQDDAWQYRRLPFPAFVEMSIIATAIGLVYTFYSGTDTLAQEQVVSAGGTDGVLPDLDKPLHEDLAATFDELTLIIRETAGAATNDAMGWVRVTQVG